MSGGSFLQFKGVGHHWCVRDPVQMGGKLHRRSAKFFNQSSKAPTPSRDQTAATVPVSRVWVALMRCCRRRVKDYRKGRGGLNIRTKRK